MDYHKIENVTVEDVKKAHMADVVIQDTYGVRYLQFWVNQEGGSVFCLVEGPDAETCEKVHKMAHGNIACALTEVETGFYEKMMGTGHRVDDHGLVHQDNGLHDNGYRTILVVSVYGVTSATASNDLSMLLTPQWARKLVREQIEVFSGRQLNWDTDDSIIGVFSDTTDTVLCALKISEQLKQFEPRQPAIIFKMGLNCSQPVTEKGDFFKDAIKMAHRLSITVPDNQVLTSSLVKKLCKNEELYAGDVIKSLTEKDEKFLSDLIGVAEIQIADQQFDLTRLSSKVCVSRPQLYRKITALTGRSPNDFISDLRMQKALTMLKQKNNNIAEIAFETGFNSPSYFTKCFTEKFGCPPSVFLKRVS